MTFLVKRRNVTNRFLPGKLQINKLHENSSFPELFGNVTEITFPTNKDILQQRHHTTTEMRRLCLISPPSNPQTPLSQQCPLQRKDQLRFTAFTGHGVGLPQSRTDLQSFHNSHDLDPVKTTDQSYYIHRAHN